jgi:hypothetical protein
MVDIEDLLERVEDVIDILLIVSDALNKGVSSMDSMTDVIEDMELSDINKKELVKFMVKFMLLVIHDVTTKLGKIKEKLEGIYKELESTG